MYLKIAETVMRLAFYDRFWLIYIPFVSFDKFTFLTQFPVDHLSYPFIPVLNLFLYGQIIVIISLISIISIMISTISV